MRAGKLRHRITIEKPVSSQSLTGAETVSWLAFATIWAEIDPKNGREAFKTGQMFELLDIVFGIRFQPGISPEMRVSYAGRTFDIQGVLNPLERDERMLIGATERGGVSISENSFSDEFTAEFA